MTMDTCLPFTPTERQLNVCTAAADKINTGIAIVDSNGLIVILEPVAQRKIRAVL